MLSNRKIKIVDEEGKEITSKDLTRKQLLYYIFQDFIKAGFIVSFLFFDLLIIGQIYRYIPAAVFLALNQLNRPVFTYLLYSYIILLTLFSECLFMLLEFVFYKRLKTRLAKILEFHRG